MFTPEKISSVISFVKCFRGNVLKNLLRGKIGRKGRKIEQPFFEYTKRGVSGDWLKNCRTSEDQ